MNTSGPLGRDSMAFQDKMKRYHAEIERLVYAAEIACAPETRCLEEDCPFFYNGAKADLCLLKYIRADIGEHVEQHDTGAP